MSQQTEKGVDVDLSTVEAIGAKERLRNVSPAGCQSSSHHQRYGFEVLYSAQSHFDVSSRNIKEIHQLHHGCQFWDDHPCFLGILFGDLSICTYQWRTGVDLLWFSPCVMWCLRSRILSCRACFHVRPPFVSLRIF